MAAIQTVDQGRFIATANLLELLLDFCRMPYGCRNVACLIRAADIYWQCLSGFWKR